MSQSEVITSISLLESKYPRGSEWRRWDLHVHTPLSQLGTSFSGVSWDDYLDRLEAEAAANEIAVIGVTDYLAIDGYERLEAAKREENRLETVHLLVPNIELRILPSTTSGQALNLHILIDPYDPDHVAKIRRALANLKYSYGGQTYGCIREQLIEFARAQNRSLVTEDQAYKFGIQQFKPDLTSIRIWLDSEGWLREHSLIGITNGNDGISGLPVGGFGAVRDEVLTKCDFVFSGNPNDRLHYLGKKPGIPPEEIIRQYSSLKPCIHGCDAHDLDTLFRPDQNRYCWIKSDPTFEGLRQVTIEPEDRIHIGTTPPKPSDKSRLISCLTIDNNKGWFAQRKIDLNEGLVAILGEKGAGKTAIADLIALTAGTPCDRRSQSSFITKGWLHLEGVKTGLLWGNGAVTSGLLPDTPHTVTRPLVRYLSQDFVERLCSSDHEGQELQTAIEEVVFSRLDELQKEGYSSFGELRRARESASNERREGFRGNIARLNKEIERLNATIEQRESKLASKEEAEKQVVALKKQLPDATQFVDQAILEQLEIEQTHLKNLEKMVGQEVRRRRSIAEAVDKYSALQTQLNSNIAEIGKILKDNGISADLITRLPPIWDASVVQLLHDEVQLIEARIEVLKGKETDDQGSDTIFEVGGKIERLRELVSKDEESRKRFLDLQKQISETSGRVERLSKEIENIDNRVRKELSQKEQSRLAYYAEFFTALQQDESGLRELYAPMQEAIGRMGAEMQFEIDVGYQIDFRAWLDKLGSFFDNRRAGADAQRKEIERFVESELAPAWKKGKTEEIAIAFRRFLNTIDPVLFMKKFAPLRMSLVELYDWMFSVDHISLSYKVKYGGTELEYLSPGTRGIALLVLYLLMDEDDTRPLIIDQPEGNLDNSSIYQQLVPYIRKAKTRRQIILITHNPNLVVATDAEQVIVATAERPNTQPYPRMTYFAGALEHTGGRNGFGTREAVCLLLEGGEKAFKDRENRYALP